MVRLARAAISAAPVSTTRRNVSASSSWAPMSRAVLVSSSCTIGSGWRRMKVPPNRPRLVSTYPAAASSRSASRKVIRLMPSLRVSSRSGGSRSPGAYTPSLTPSSSRSTVSSKALPVRTARNTAAVMAGDPPGTVLIS